MIFFLAWWSKYSGGYLLSRLLKSFLNSKSTVCSISVAHKKKQLQQFSSNLMMALAGYGLEMENKACPVDAGVWNISILVGNAWMRCQLKCCHFQLTLPPWPMYRHKPLKWQPPRNYEDEEDDGSQLKSIFNFYVNESKKEKMTLKYKLDSVVSLLFQIVYHRTWSHIYLHKIYCVLYLCSIIWWISRLFRFRCFVSLRRYWTIVGCFIFKWQLAGAKRRKIYANLQFLNSNLWCKWCKWCKFPYCNTH